MVSDGYKYPVWLFLFPYDMTAVLFSTFTKWRISNWSLIGRYNRRLIRWPGEHVTTRERWCIVAAVTVLIFLQKQWLVFLFFCFFFGLNMNYGCMLQKRLTLLLLMYFFLPSWMITTKQTRWTCSNPKILWFLPSTLPLISSSSSHTVLRIMWLHFYVSLHWVKQAAGESKSKCDKKMLVYRMWEKYYLIIWMWIRALDGREQHFGMKQVQCLPKTRSRHEFNSYALLCLSRRPAWCLT